MWCFAGNVIRADINLDSDNKSKGFGTVQFETATEAINAVCILSCWNIILVCDCLKPVAELYTSTFLASIVLQQEIIESK